MTTRRIASALLLLLGLTGFLASPSLAFAQRSQAGEDALQFLDAIAVTGGLTDANKAVGSSSESAVLSVISNIINVILGFIGVIFFIQMFYAGFKWMSSGGNDEMVSESKQTIRNAVIGIVVVFGAFIITNFVLNQIASITGPTRPQAPIEIPIDSGEDPNLGAGAEVLDFGDLTDEFRNCLYPMSSQCGFNGTYWTGQSEYTTEAECSTLGEQQCPIVTPNYERF